MSTLLWLLFFSDPAQGMEINGIHFPALASAGLRLCFLLAVLGIVYGAWRAYRAEPQWIDAGRKRMLIACRVSAGLIVLFCLTGATLELGSSQPITRTVAILVDRSASMSWSDSGAAQSRARQAEAMVNSSGLTTPGPNLGVRLFTVGAAAEIREITGTTPTLALDATDQASRLGDGLRDLKARVQGENLREVILISDGGWNRGEDPREVARTLGVPIHTITIGNVSGLDAAVVAVECPSRVQVGDQIPVKVRVSARGLAGKSFKLSLKIGDNALPEREVAIRDRTDWHETFLWKPEKAGTVTLRANIAALPGEVTTANNSAERAGVLVVDETTPVLVIDKAPRWEWRQVKGVLDRDTARYKTTYVLFDVDPDLARDPKLGWRSRMPTREELRRFRMIWLGDVTPEDLASSAADLESWVRDDGGGLIISSGPRGMPGTWDGASPIGRLLPIEPSPVPSQTAALERERPLTASYLAVITSDGQQQPWWKIDSDDTASRQRWEKAEPFYWYAASLGAKPGATVWMQHPTLKINGAPLPLLARQRVGRGHVLWLGVQETWRWRHQPGAAFHRRMWSHWFADLATLDGGSERVQLAADRSTARVGESVVITARLRDAQGKSQRMDAADLIIERQTGDAWTVVDRLKLPAKADEPGRYDGVWVATAPGIHRCTAPAYEAPGASTIATLIVPISATDLELTDPSARPELMKAIAEASGGRVLDAAGARDLAQAWRAEKMQVREQREEKPLWNAPLLLLLLCLALGCEWFLRKRSDLT